MVGYTDKDQAFWREQRLVERAEGAERALLKTWQRDTEAGYYCAVCGTGAIERDHQTHAEDCIIPELERRYE